MPKPRRIFLSASVPLPTRNAVYFKTADVIGIRDAIRALTMVVAEAPYELIFGGHPAIMPMVRLQLSQMGLNVGDHVHLFLSQFFVKEFPRDAAAFGRISLIDAIDNDSEKSLLSLRKEMLKGPFECGFFIGGMEGVEDEYCLFRQMHSDVPAFPIASTGAAAGRIYSDDKTLQANFPELQNELTYLSLLRRLTALSSRKRPSVTRRTEVTLVAGTGDLKVNDPAFQKQIAEVSRMLRAGAVDFHQRGMAFDAADAEGFPLPEFMIALGSTTVGPVAAICALWIASLPGRKVLIQIGNFRAEGRTSAEIDALLERAMEVQARENGGEIE